MPMVTTPGQDIPDTPNLVINPTPYESQVVDTRKESYDSIASFLAGSKWPVDWYSQKLGRDSAAASFQADLPFVYGQYHLVRGFELVITSPLSFQQNSSDQRGFSASGSAQVYSLITPNLGDVFIADIGDGRNAIFQVTSTNRPTIHPESTTLIDFRASFLLTEERANALNGRVVETSVFDRENFRNGIKALLTSNDVTITRRLQKAASRLINLYMRDFYNERFKTLIVPDQGLPTYDPYVTGFVKATIDPRSHPRLMEVVQFGMGGDPLNDQQSLFDMILDRDPDLLYSCFKRAGVADIVRYKAPPLYNSIYYTGIGQVVSPKDPVWNADNPEYTTGADGDIVDGKFRQTGMVDVLPNLNLADPKPVAQRPLIYPVSHDDYYVFSEHFYNDDVQQSLLEQLTRDRMENRHIDLNDLAVIAEAAPTWKNLERFYYIPIILTLIKLSPGVL